MPRQPTILQIGLPIDANLLKSIDENGVDKYFVSEIESQATKTDIQNAQTTADTAVTNAGTAQTTANNAITTANNSQIMATTAAAKANNAVYRLSGDTDYWEGTGTFTGTPSNLVITSMTPISASGIDYSGGRFNFAFTGKYLVIITQSGDCTNTRTDWYQEVTIRLKELGSSVFTPFTFKTLPPSGTWSMENTTSNIIEVKSGDLWTPVVNMTALGSTTNGLFRVKIKKVI